MQGAKGDALEWALALLRSPGERHALRRRPLPSDMQRLLGIAAGAMPAELADAALGAGETEARVREATQFYAREVLFHPSSDAYRTLGVAADAEQAQIKQHFRLLQHWLHPDRLQSEDDAVFAGRVNAAWNQLRTQDRRAAYDATLQTLPAPEAPADEVRGPQADWLRHAPPPDVPVSRWRHRLPVLALTVACLGLGALVVLDSQRDPDAWRGPAEEGATASAALDLALPDAPPAAPAAARAASRPSGSSTRPQRAPAVAEAIPARAVATMVAAETAPAARPEIAPVAPAGVPATAVASRQPTRLPAPALAVAAPLVPTPAMTPPATPASAPAAVAVARVVPSAPAPVPSPAVAPARVRQAQQAGTQLLNYLGQARRPPPPIWNSPGIQSSAVQLRDELHAGGPVRLAAPEWRIGGEAASVSAAYATRAGGGAGGRVTADMVWRDGQWLVTGLSLERAR